MKKTAIAAFLLAAIGTPGVCASYDEVNAGISYFNLGRYDDAIIWFDKALAAGDLSTDLKHLAYLDRGQAYLAKKDTQKALSDFAQALAVKPDSVIAHRHRISIYLVNNDREKALAELQALSKLRPDNLDVLMNIGMLNWQQGDTEASARAFQPFSDRIIQSWLWLQLTNLRLGKPLGDFREDIFSRWWPGPLARFYRGSLSETALLSEAEDAHTGNNASRAKNTEARCNAFFFAGMWRIARGETGAAPLLQNSIEACGETSMNSKIARFELDRLADREGKK